MVLWGAIWGAIVGYLTSRYDEGLGFILGGLLGTLAGWSLRKAVRKELETMRVQGGVPAAVIEPGLAAADYPAADEPPAESRQPAATDEEAEVVAPSIPYRVPVQVAPAYAAETFQPPELVPAVFSRAFDQARNWLLGGNTIVRAGVLVLFVGLAFLAKFAIDNALLPPEVRLAGIGLAGVALLVFGWWLQARQTDKLAYALTLQGAGVAVLYLTVFAAFRLYQFLPAGSAFVLLALICAFSTAIALLQNALVMAFIGFAGAFAAPLLVSTGQGDHVGLFSYYLLLGVGIAVIAWLRAWRALNLLGFVATFGVATLWGVLKYQPEQLATTEPFLLAFFALYLLASLMYATRHGLQPGQAVDATLVFGLPLVAFGLQAGLVREVEYATAFSALALGGLYLGLGWWAHKRHGEVGQWLAECFVALGLGFATLAVPLALDARWTSAVWAAEGAGVYWLGQRQGRWLARLAGLLLQVLAALSYLQGLHHLPLGTWPLANPTFIGALLLAVSALALAHWTRNARDASSSHWAQELVKLETKLSPALFWVGFLWWQFALLQEFERAELDAQGNWQPWLEVGLQTHLQMLAWLASAWLAQRWAQPARAQPWAIAATPAWFSLPLMALFAWQGVVELDHVFQAWGWLAWPLALALHAQTLRRLDALPPASVWSWTHTGGVWLLVLLAGNLLVWAVQQAQLQGTAWASVIFLVASVLVLLAMSRRSLFDAQAGPRKHWPLDRFAQAYLWRAAAPLAVIVGLGALLVALNSNGNAQPLPYVPLLNPTDLSVALALLACTLWLTRVRGSDLPVPAWLGDARWTLLLAGLAFVALNTVWLRVAHQYAGVAWNAERLFDSFLVQAGYSILWTLLALGLMLVAHRRHARGWWMGGAGLLTLTVAKLFLVDLSNQGGSERIVAFIAVGALMLVVGYVAPMPPARERSEGEVAL